MKLDGAEKRPKIILASASPRRRALLTGMGVDFSAVSCDVDEHVNLPPDEAVAVLARRKARAAAENLSSGIVIGADTLVSLAGRALGKPRDEADARAMLRALSGAVHEVCTGLCLIDAATGREDTRVDRTRITFRDLTDQEIEDYVATGEPMDKAGAYAIQGGARPFVIGIDGSFENVMGLPVDLLAAMLQAFGG